MSEEKTIFQKIEELGGKEGVIQLSEKNKREFIEGGERYIEKESEKRDNFIWLLIGLGIGILGNFVVNLFYDWIKSLGGWKFDLMSFAVILLFLMIVYILIDKLREFKQNIDSIYESNKLWRRAKNLRVGPAK